MSSLIRVSRDPDGDDEYYMEKMKEILEGFPNTGPPKHPGRLMDYVFIGNQDNAEDYDLLPAIGITHVLNCAGTRTFDLTKSRYPPKLGIVGFLMMPAEDYDEFDIMQYFPDAIAFLDKAKAAGGKALVHCNLGVNRSGAISAAYMMVSQRKPLLKVMSELKAKRGVVLCNVGFRRQLLKYARARGLLDPVEEPAKVSPSRTLEASSEQKNKYLSETTRRKERADVTPTRSDVVNGYSDEAYSSKGSSYLNGDSKAMNGDIKANLIATEAYASQVGSSYKSMAMNNVEDWLSDDDMDKIMTSKSSTAYKPRVSNQSNGHYTTSNVFDSTSSSADPTRFSNLNLTPTSNYYPTTSYTSFNGTERNGSSHYSSYTPTVNYIPDTSSASSVVANRSRDVTPSYSNLSSTGRELSSTRMLDDIDFKSLDTPATPVTDNYEMTRNSSTSSLTGPSDLISSNTGRYLESISSNTGRYLESIELPVPRYDIDSVIDAKTYLDTSVTLSPSHSLGLDPLLFTDTSPSVHPLLAKPPSRFSTCSSDSFKTTVKPRSYYHRKVIGRAPKYSDIDDIFLQDLSDSYNGNKVDYSSPRVNYATDLSYTSPARRYSVSSSATDYQPRPYSSADYVLSGLTTSRSSVPTYDSYRTTSRDHARSSSVGRSGQSYKPSYSSRAGYIKDLDDDIEAFNGNASRMPIDSSMRSIRTRIVAPPGYSSYSYGVPVYGW